MHDEDNDGRFPDESPVEVRYPRSEQEEQGDRERWPWLPGTIVEQCGMRMGWDRFRSAAAASVWIGVAGTIVTAAGVAAAAHVLFSFGWHAALLIGTALAPTDPAVVFSVLGRREITGRSGVLLEGEAGANDPVGIALLIALLGATGTGVSTAGQVAVVFVVQMAVGVVIGAAGGRALLAFMRRVPLPSEGLYTLRVLAGALAIYGLAAVAHGSGFLAVFIAGILIGDERAPYKGEIAHFHSALASLAEVVAFVMLGLTIRLYALPRAGAWLTGLALAALLAFVIRPLLVGVLLWPVRLRRSERLFVLWAGLKGAVPILLGAFIVGARIKGAPVIYEIIFAVVAFSVIVQGGTVPGLARRLKIPVRTIEPEPWSLGIRFQEEPEGRTVSSPPPEPPPPAPRSASCRFLKAPGSALSSATATWFPRRQRPSCGRTTKSWCSPPARTNPACASFSGPDCWLRRRPARDRHRAGLAAVSQ